MAALNLCEMELKKLPLVLIQECKLRGFEDSYSILIQVEAGSNFLFY